MALGLVTQFVRRALPDRPTCLQCGRNAGNRVRQVWSSGELFCSTRCCEARHGQELYFH